MCSSDLGLILCHGFPTGPIDARQSAGTFPELIDRIANELGWVAMTFTFRGCGRSEGDFSLQGWVDDLRSAIDHLIEETSPSGIWLVGTSTGGSIAMCVGADDPRVRGRREVVRRGAVGERREKLPHGLGERVEPDGVLDDRARRVAGERLIVREEIGRAHV